MYAVVLEKLTTFEPCSLLCNVPLPFALRHVASHHNGNRLKVVPPISRGKISIDDAGQEPSQVHARAAINVL